MIDLRVERLAMQDFERVLRVMCFSFSHLLKVRMPPKKGGKGGKGKKKKKGSGQTEEEAFQDYLNEMFFIAPQDRERMRDQLRTKIKAGFTVFQGDRDGLAEIRELGTMVRMLGLNPTVQQLRHMQPIVQDESGTHVVYSKFESLMIELLESHEMKYQVPASDGAPVTATHLVYKDSTDVVEKAFEVLWQHSGKKVDPERNRYLDAEPLRELLTRAGHTESFDDQEASEFLNTAADPDSGFIKEDLFTTLCLE